MSIIDFIILGVSAAGGWFAVTHWIGHKRHDVGENSEKECANCLKEAREEGQKIKEEAKSKLVEMVEQEKGENERLQELLNRQEEALKLKERQVQSSEDKNHEVEKKLAQYEEDIQEFERRIVEDRVQFIELLLKKIGKSKQAVFEEAASMLYHEVADRKERYIKHRLEELEEEGMKIGKAILVGAIQRYDEGETSVDRSVSSVEVEQEQFKVMMVGEKAQNIQYLETVAEVDIVFNDAPKTITISGANLIKRQVVRYAIESLQKSNKPINPQAIDVALKKGEERVNLIMKEAAYNALKKVQLKEAPEGILNHLGRLHFRTSYGQNALKHCIEVGIFSGLIAAEIGADVEVARLAGFFHDIGKSLSEESDKGHDYITKDILEEFNMPESIIHAAWVHHEAEPAKSLEAKIVMAADAISASRPGARLESLERYLQRIRELEVTAASFPGIKKTFAISAGREVRVVVKPNEVSDERMVELAHQIADKIERELTYPGNVKVNLIRRMKWQTKAKEKMKK